MRNTPFWAQNTAHFWIHKHTKHLWWGLFFHQYREYVGSRREVAQEYSCEYVARTKAIWHIKGDDVSTASFLKPWFDLLTGGRTSELSEIWTWKDVSIIQASPCLTCKMQCQVQYSFLKKRMNCTTCVSSSRPWLLKSTQIYI